MSKQLEEVFSKQTTRVKSIAFHPTNPVLITGNHCGTVYLWNYLYQQVIAVLPEHSGSVRVVKMHPAGDLFATAGDDKILRVWNYKTRKVVQRLKAHTDYIRCLDFHPTKPWIVTGSDDCTIKIWNFYTGEQISSSCGHTHYIMSVLFLDSTHILTASLDHTMTVWNCAKLFEKSKFMVPDVVVSQVIEAHDRGVNCLYQSGTKVVSGSDDHEIKVWKYVNEALVLEKTISGHEGNINSVYTDGEIIYGGGEDCNLTSFLKKTEKLALQSRIWCVTGRDNYIALGTDDGLQLYKKNSPMAFCVSDDSVYFSMGKHVQKFNMKQSIDLFKTKENVQEIVKHKDCLYVMYNDAYEIYRNDRRDGGDYGSVAFIEEDLYCLKNETLYKNDSVYRSNITGKIYSNNKCLIIIDKKNITRIFDNNEFSSIFNFTVKTVKFSKTQDCMAIIGSNKILIVDFDFKVLNTINELVEIIGGFFHEDIFVYTTLKHIKFFYEDTGILQSVDTFTVPVTIKDNYLIVLNNTGIQKILLNVSEIRFRRAVFKDENILSVIEEEQLPGLSPLEYLIRKNKGGIALPYIKNEEKRFQLFLSDKNFEEALKLSFNMKMNTELAYAALKEGRYDISEICFKKNQDNTNLFYLYLSTKQFEKMKDLEGDDIGNMVKVILDDAKVLPVERKDNDERIEIVKDIKNLKIQDQKQTTIISEDKKKDKIEIEQDSSDESKEEESSSNDLPVKDEESSISEVLANDEPTKIEAKNEPTKSELRIEPTKSELKIEPTKSELKIESSSDEELTKELSENNNSLEEEQALNKNLVKFNESSNSSESESILRNSNQKHENSSQCESDATFCISDAQTFQSDLATCNSEHSTISDLPIYEPSEIALPEGCITKEYTEFYTAALEFTTQGKFIKAIENFKISISLIALKIRKPSDFLETRKSIGNYILGLNVEKMRKSVTDPVMNMQMSLFFASLGLQPEHLLLAKNLALTTCYKNENFKTAKKIAKENPNCKNSKKILESREDEDKHVLVERAFFIGTTEEIEDVKECALCFVKSGEGEFCPACSIGNLY